MEKRLIWYFIRILPAAAVLACIALVYAPWFFYPGTLSAGDWPYLHIQTIRDMPFYPVPFFLWLEPYYQMTAKFGVDVLSLSWEAVERVFWFVPFVVVSSIASFIFVRTCLEENRSNGHNIFFGIGALIYTTNTYILMVTGGGQMGVAMAYALAPFIVRSFYMLIRTGVSTKFMVASVCIVAVQCMFDPRLSIITLGFGVCLGVVTALHLNVTIQKRLWQQIGILIAGGLCANAWWYLPNASFFSAEMTHAASEAGPEFLSFADFSHTISLIHPNWYENIFGKVYFLRAEFLVLPLLAYARLLWAYRKSMFQRIMVAFALISLIGAFLAKGTNPPFGAFFTFLFTSVPGFVMFRDPTKFYLIIVLSYSILIPSTLAYLSESTARILRNKHIALSGIALMFIVFWVYSIRPAIAGSLTGTFDPFPMPQSYIMWETERQADTIPVNVLWIPRASRFAYAPSDTTIHAVDIFFDAVANPYAMISDTEDIRSWIDSEGIWIVVVPTDPKKELFTAGNNYDPLVRETIIQKLSIIPWLMKDTAYTDLAVFRVDRTMLKNAPVIQ